MKRGNEPERESRVFVREYVCVCESMCVCVGSKTDMEV